MWAVIAVFDMPHPGGDVGPLNGIIARISHEEGFVAGYWTHDGTMAHNMLVFHTQEQAELRATDIRGNADNQRAFGIFAVQITVSEVVGHAP